MGMTSAAEAKLDARIRPDITILRSRTSYPPRHRPALAVLPGGADLAIASERGGADLTSAAEPRSPTATRSARAASEGPALPRPRAVASAAGSRAVSAPRPAPIRLTRRGRIIVGLLAVVVAAGLAALVWLAVAGRAQAAGHVRPGAPVARSMLRVVVRPGDTLWSIAAKADPSADPRIVIRQIMDDNALTGTAITAGQVLWVPRI